MSIRSRKSEVSSPFASSHPDRGRARANGIGRRLDAVQTRAQGGAKAVDGQAQGLPLGRQFQKQLFLVIAEIVLKGRHFAKALKLCLQSLGGTLQHVRAGTRKLHVDGIAARAAPPAAKADRFQQGVLGHRILQVGDKGKAGIGAQVGVDQFNGDRAQLIALFRFGSRQPAPRIAADFGQGKLDRVGAMVGLVLRTQVLDRLLHGLHDLEGIFTRRARDHGEIAGDRTALGRVEETPLNIARYEQYRLAGERDKGQRDDRVARPDHEPDEGAEDPIANEAEALRSPAASLANRTNVLSPYGSARASCDGAESESIPPAKRPEPRSP